MAVIYYRIHESPKSLNEYLTSLQDEREEPILSWIDPKPGPTSNYSADGSSKVQIVYNGLPSLAHPIDEVGLFWENSALRAVSMDNSGCRVFEFSEEEPDARSDYCIEEVKVRSDRILLRRDWDRYGLMKPTELLEFTEADAIQYFREGTLLAWRLVPLKSPQPKKE